jgi:hypothetical protein
MGSGSCDRDRDRDAGLRRADRWRSPLPFTSFTLDLQVPPARFPVACIHFAPEIFPGGRSPVPQMMSVAAIAEVMSRACTRQKEPMHEQLTL